MIEVWNVVIQRASWHGHVLAFGFDPVTGVWVVVDPHRRGTEVQLLPPWEFDAWIQGIADTGEVYRIAAQRSTPTIVPGLWCVGAVKRLVGLRSGALFPAGLRRDLLRAGARRVFNRESEDASRGERGSRRHRGA